MSRQQLTLIIDENTPLPGVDTPALARAAADVFCQTLSPACAGSKKAEAGLRLAACEEIQALNKRYRGKDVPTNVLSFPAGTGPVQRMMPLFYLGDIIMAPEIIMQEAGERNIPPAHHFQHLLLHGLLHLCDYDHQIKSEAATMEEAEIRMLEKLSIPNPYE